MRTQLASGSTYKNVFADDNFASRRTTGHNGYDPESLITGAEVAAGLTYYNPRVWPSIHDYLDAVEGYIDVNEVIALAPRRSLLKFDVTNV